MSLRLVVAAMVLLVPAAASATEELCGSGTATSGSTEVYVTVNQQTGQPPVTYFVTARTLSDDKAVRLGVVYDPVGDKLGQPRLPDIQWSLDIPNLDQAEPQRIVWRVGTETWTGPSFSSKPISNDPARRQGRLSGFIRPDHAFTLLTAIAEGARVDMQRLSEDGRTLGENNVRHPPASAMQPLYVKARASAVANLKTCGPPLEIPPLSH